MPVSTVFSRDPTAAPRAARAYRGGASLRELAAEWGVSYSKVRLVLLGEGVTLRPKGGARSRRPATNITAPGASPGIGDP